MIRRYSNQHDSMKGFISKLLLLFFLVLMISSCSISKQINNQAGKVLLRDSVISTGHTGISIYEPATDKYWYNYDATKYFVPASNTKLFSLYAALKYLGDSLTGVKYALTGDTLFIQPTGDPTFLHPDFDSQPLLELMKNNGHIIFIAPSNTIAPYGKGWAWDDYDQSYVAEINPFPMFGNLLWLSTKMLTRKNSKNGIMTDTLKYFQTQELYIRPKFFADKISKEKTTVYLRNKNENKFFIDSITGTETVPFITGNRNTQQEILSDLLHKEVKAGDQGIKKYEILKLQKTDSVLAPMMHNSDNFFAEQILLMASNEHLGYMNCEVMIDTLLNTDLKQVPQKPKWVDGSGLSRYNLFTPQSFVYILNKMKNEFGLERLKTILPTGGEGTLKNYYITDKGFIFAKTGTLSNHAAFSGYLITKKNKLLIFSILNNHFIGRATTVRRAVEKFLNGIRNKY